MIEKAHLLISGKVQGVYFRYHTRQEAKRLGLFGWVKNLPDGRVEVMAEGEKENLDRLVEWCRKGPVSAKVENVGVGFMKGEEEFQTFKITYD